MMIATIFVSCFSNVLIRTHSTGDNSLSVTHLWFVTSSPPVVGTKSTIYTVVSSAESILATAPSIPFIWSAFIVTSVPSSNGASSGFSNSS